MEMFLKSGNLMSGNIPFDLDVGLDAHFRKINVQSFLTTK